VSQYQIGLLIGALVMLFKFKELFIAHLLQCNIMTKWPVPTHVENTLTSFWGRKTCVVKQLDSVELFEMNPLIQAFSITRFLMRVIAYLHIYICIRHTESVYVCTYISSMLVVRNRPKRQEWFVFMPKISIWIYFGMEWKLLIYFTTICNILRPYLWYIFGRLV
jgi:hypothetical protein